jgi:outer membrane protein TolC
VLSWIVCLSFYSINLKDSEGGVPQSLQSYLEWAEQVSPELRSLRKKERATFLKRGGELLDLSPRFQVEWTETWDERQRNSANARQFDRTALLELSTQLPSGTKLSLSSAYEKTKWGGLVAGGSHDLDWSAELRQSLWRDFLGRGIRAELRAEELRYKMEELETKIQVAQKLADLENLFWELSALKQERTLRSRNQEKSRELLRWVRDRLSRSAAERGDLYQAESLLTRRELELQELMDREEVARSRWSVFFDQVSPPQEWSPSELARPRDLSSLVQGSGEQRNSASRLDLRLRFLQIERTRALLDLSRDSARPDLSLIARAGTNAIRPEFSRTFSDSFSNPVYELGLFFSTPLNFRLLSRLSEAAQIQNDAARDETESLRLSHLKDWSEFKRRWQSLRDRLEVAERLVRLQKNKSEEEARRYRQGRSTAFQAISFEQEAAEAELLRLHLQLQMRKWESQARLYAWDSGVFQ